MNLMIGAWMLCVYLPRWASTRPGKKDKTRTATTGSIPCMIARRQPREDSLRSRTGRRDVLLPIVRRGLLCFVLVCGRYWANRADPSTP